MLTIKKIKKVLPYWIFTFMEKQHSNGTFCKALVRVSNSNQVERSSAKGQIEKWA